MSTATTRAARVVARMRAAASADGADDSGLAALLWVHALQASGDAMIAVALAGTVFFDVPLGQARGRMALFLLLTLLPFALLVPVAGPLLDHFRHGRRNVLALTTGVRGLVAWSMAGALASLSLYPQALIVLVLTRAYGVARNAAVVKVRPPDLGLVAANARLNIAATLCSGLAAAFAVGVSRTLGSDWALRVASLLLIGAAVAALRLPSQVDEVKALAGGSKKYRLVDAPAVIRKPLVATVALRVLGGLLTVDLAFLLKAQGAPGPVTALVLGSALVGSLAGTALAGQLKASTTARLTAAALVVPTAACLLAALVLGTTTATLAVGISGLAASLAKYALDAALQTHVPAGSVSGAFARSETALQLGWAFGAGLGLVLSAVTEIGLGTPGARALCFAVATAVPIAGLIADLRWRAPDARSGAAGTVH